MFKSDKRMISVTKLKTKIINEKRVFIIKFKLLIKKLSVCILSCIMVFVAFTPTMFATFEYDEPLLCVAAKEGNLDKVQQLVTGGANVNCTGYLQYTPLHYAAIEGYLEVVEYLVNEGHADINCRDADGRTPLHKAAIVGNLEVIRWLIEEGQVDVNYEDEQGRTSLFFAAINGHLETVRYLVGDRFADINFQDEHNQTPLHMATVLSSSEVVRWLV